MHKKTYYGLGIVFILLTSITIFMLMRNTDKDKQPEKVYVVPERKTSPKQPAESTTQTAEKQPIAAKTVTETTSLQSSAENTSVAAPNSPELPKIGEMVDGRIFLGTEPPSPELLAELRAALRTQDEIISPYGFGPYPELPEGFGPITWPRKSANSELMIRVRIKLLNQGVPVEGIAMENGLVYPIIKGVRYVRWAETPDGRQYLSDQLGHPDDGEYMDTITDAKSAAWESETAADFPEMQLISMEEGGIDPYTFLNLPK